MPESSHAQNAFLVPETQTNPLHPSYSGHVPARLSEEFELCCLRHAPIVTPLPGLVPGYLDRYLKFISVSCLC